MGAMGGVAVMFWYQSSKSFFSVGCLHRKCVQDRQTFQVVIAL